MLAQQIIKEMCIKISAAIEEVRAYRSNEANAKVPLPAAILTCLEEMEQNLRGKDHISDGYRKGLFGLYRILTDSWLLESSPIGQSLMDLQGDLYELSKQL